MEEIWKDIAGYEGLYQVSNLGNVKSLNWGRHGFSRILTPKVSNSGRLAVQLSKFGEVKYYLIHRLVASAFIPNPCDYNEINHIDENPVNNRVDNLEWCDHLYNVRCYLANHPSYHKERKSSSNYGKRLALQIEQLDQDGQVVRRWKNSREIVKETGMSDWSISECCRGKRKSAYGFKWRYAS